MLEIILLAGLGMLALLAILAILISAFMISKDYE